MSCTAVSYMWVFIMFVMGAQFVYWISGDELLSDSFPCKEIENGMLLEVEGKVSICYFMMILFCLLNPIPRKKDSFLLGNWWLENITLIHYLDFSVGCSGSNWCRHWCKPFCWRWRRRWRCWWPSCQGRWYCWHIQAAG